MSWDTGLLSKQRVAASHIGFHARLLAGPGTGKTFVLSKRIAYLIQQKKVSADTILALTFTRAAAHELEQKTRDELGNTIVLPRISTLHAFSLRQLLKNSDKVNMVPRPLRIADDWEERHIILENLKNILKLDRIDRVREKLNQLSADWETLSADKKNWEQTYPDPSFIGAWQQHRKVFGYTLRSELVYQLKKAIEQTPGFTLEQKYDYMLVDEYQDLNLCDLAVVKAISAQGAEVFAAGDDDQSIYGFRFAYPDGIRKFGETYEPFTPLDLDECTRCDKSILQLGLFVADLDPKRAKKPLKASGTAGEGEVRLLWFQDQDEEADGVARLCKLLIEHRGYDPAKILILLRADRHGMFSKILQQALERHGVPVAARAENDSPLDTDEGRIFLGFLRLCINRRDHLAWRTLLALRKNSVGEAKLNVIYDLAVQKGLHYTDALESVAQNPNSFSAIASPLAQEWKTIGGMIDACDQTAELSDLLTTMLEKVIEAPEARTAIAQYLSEVATSVGTTSLSGLLSGLSASLGDKEQEIASDSVNILTMHKAKGLTADAVFIVAAEDEYLPGNQLGEEKEGDERRLFYVSLTRAKHSLYMTYCKKRTKQQKYTGRGQGEPDRTLTRFLRDAWLRPEGGISYLGSIGA
ncbi:MAG: ATP-dependent helicase [Chloroflexi bacterium]|nr:ATP-dependent helicase [Chloroflexota bacterium]